MDIFSAIIIFWLAIAFTSLRQQKIRILLLGKYLSHYRIEYLMREINDGYMRALNEERLDRKNQIWMLMRNSEQLLAEQFEQFTSEFSQADSLTTQASLLSIGIPFADRLFPKSIFDMRNLLKIHAHSLHRAINSNENISAKDRAKNILAELYLIQHSCHWFCKSKNIASARLYAQHQITYDSLLSMLSKETLDPYRKLMHPS